MPTASSKSPLAGLFRRLKKVGYDQPFLRLAVLPDWWDDQLADNATAWAQMQLRVAQRLSLPLADLMDAAKPLSIAGTGKFRLKRAKTATQRAVVAPGMIAAHNAVHLVAPHLPEMPDLPANLTAAGLRQWVLNRNSTVDLGGLVEAGWIHGIAFFHFSPLPTRKFAGMAYYEGDRPVVVLASGHDEPPRLAFHLAHEIGHVIRGHVKPGGPILAEASFDSAGEDQDEREADMDALELLTGRKDHQLGPLYGMTALKLANESCREEQRSGIHAGTLALIYGKSAKRMPVAVNALKLMNMGSGARAIIAGALGRRLRGKTDDADELSGAVVELLPLFALHDAR